MNERIFIIKMMWNGINFVDHHRPTQTQNESEVQKRDKMRNSYFDYVPKAQQTLAWKPNHYSIVYDSWRF